MKKLVFILLLMSFLLSSCASYTGTVLAYNDFGRDLVVSIGQDVKYVDIPDIDFYSQVYPIGSTINISCFVERCKVSE